MLKPRYHIGQKVTYLDSKLCPKKWQFENKDCINDYYYGGAGDEIIGTVGEVLDILMDDKGESHLMYEVSLADGGQYSMREYEFEEYYDIFPEDVY